MKNEIPTNTDANGIQYLHIDLLQPHPDNPRKDVGDVTELAESIKANGILQNLTVVPYKDGTLRVIIGHRRLAAAKLAGIEVVPCVVAEMTEKEQISTMLTENMQRVDLSIYEQAQGFQMMLDMGDTMEDIADKSGFSKTTVRKRLEIAKLDGKALKKATEERQVTMADFDKLSEIEDIEVRNKLLSSIGTKNFNNDLTRELQNQKTKARILEWLEVVKTFATEIQKDAIDRDKMNYICNYSWYRLTDDVQVPEDADKVKYYYTLSQSEIDIYKDRDIDKEKADWEIREERRRMHDEEREKWYDINNRHFNLRKEFVKNISNSTCKRVLGEVLVLLMYISARVNGYYNSPKLDKGTYGVCMGVKINEQDRESGELTDIPCVRDAVNAFPEKATLCLAYSTGDNNWQGYWKEYWDVPTQSYKYRHEENPMLDKIYNLLTSLGYEMSDEEKQMQNGTYEDFTNEVADDE